MPTVDLRLRPHRNAAGQAPPPQPSPRMLVWVEQIEGTPQYPLQFRTRGRGPNHTLVPLDQIMDERYSVYLRNITHNLIEHNGARRGPNKQERSIQSREGTPARLDLGTGCRLR